MIINMTPEESDRLRHTRYLLLGHVSNLPKEKQDEVARRVAHLKLRVKRDGDPGMLALSIAMIELQVGI